jgi:hypothetical protein
MFFKSSLDRTSYSMSTMALKFLARFAAELLGANLLIISSSFL